VRHAATLALFFTFHNFATAAGRPTVSPAMAVGISDHIWDAAEIVGLLE
jgi:hypothetical protein